MKIGNMRFERIAECGDVWTGVLELEGKEIPIFGCVDEIPVNVGEV